jgi:hypothetical protein
MAITNIKEHAFLSGTFDRENYACSVEYQVYTDSHLDGPDTIRRNPFFRLGKQYSFGNDRNPAATLKSISVKGGRRTNAAASGSGGLWRVECSFDTTKEKGKKPEGGDGGGGDEPGTTDEPDTDDGGSTFATPYLEIVYQTKREIVNRAKWIRTVKVDSANNEAPHGSNSFDLYHGGKFIGPVCSSAFVPKVPAPEKEIGFPVIRLSGNLTFAEVNANFESLAAMVGKINATDFVIQGPPAGAGRFRRNFTKHALLISNVSVGRMERNAEFELVQTQVEFVVDYGLHLIKDLDEGYARLADQASFNDRVNNSNPETEVLRDERGAPLQNPVLLNAEGDVLRKSRVTGTKDSKSVFYNYWIDAESERDFNNFAILKPGVLF